MLQRFLYKTAEMSWGSSELFPKAPQLGRATHSQKRGVKFSDPVICLRCEPLTEKRKTSEVIFFPKKSE